MTENYNRFRESLNIDCCCNSNENTTPTPTSTDPCGCGNGCNLPSNDNTLEILVKQLKREVRDLMKSTTTKLLCQDKKIAETCVYIKNNLSNYLRNMFDSMLVSGEIERIIKDIILDDVDDLQQYLQDYEQRLQNLEQNLNTNTENISNLRNDQTKLESDIKKLDSATDENKTDINNINQTINNIRDNIANLQTKKIDANIINDDFEIDSKFQNIDFITDYDNDSIIYITRITNIDKISVLPTNGDKIANPNLNKKNVKSYAESDADYDLYINGGMNGIYIFDGYVNQTTRLDCPYYCGLTENNDMRFYEGLTNEITASQLVADGIVNCFSGFAPLITNHNIANYTSLENLYNTNEIAKAFIDSLPVKHPRQILAQDDNNNFYILSIMGRFNNSQGMNYAEMKDYCNRLGFKNAFNCDGGGSMQTIYNNEYVFYPSQELDTNIDREIPSVVAFKIEEV